MIPIDNPKPNETLTEMKPIEFPPNLNCATLPRPNEIKIVVPINSDRKQRT